MLWALHVRVWSHQSADGLQGVTFISTSTHASRGAAIRYYRRHLRAFVGHDYVQLVPEHRRKDFDK